MRWSDSEGLKYWGPCIHTITKYLGENSMYTRLVAATLILLFALVTPVSAVTNGQPDTTNHYSFVGMVTFYNYDSTGGLVYLWRCSGALIRPTVFLTAGHCTYDDVYNNRDADVARVWFDWNLTDLSRPYLDPKGHKYYEGKPIANPEYIHGSGENGLVGFDTHDVGLVILKKPVKTVGLASLPSKYLVDTLPMNTEVTIVGYGVQYKLQTSGDPYYRWDGLRMRFVAPSLLIQSDDRISDEYLKLTANPAQGKGGTCFGDSGGPILLGGTNTVLGVNSFVTNSNCEGVTYSNRVDTYALAWINGYL
jgi:V8-like Glu-specific endopeptidase